MGVPDWGDWNNMGGKGNPQDQPDGDDNPGPNQGVEDEDEDVEGDRRRAPANGDQRDPKDDDEVVWSDPDG